MVKYPARLSEPMMGSTGSESYTAKRRNGSFNGLLKQHRKKVRTITPDNGKEFSGHEEIANKLKADFYFAHPYSSWERGLNENSNGLLRQYFPKGMDLTEITDEQVQMAADRLNHRPRKVLGFRTPHEVFFEVKVLYTKQPLEVALLN